MKSLGPRDLLTSIKGSHSDSWESTTNVLEQFAGNALSKKFITASPPAAKKQSKLDENSPPQNHLVKIQEDESSKIVFASPVRKRILNPTRSPSSNTLLPPNGSASRTSMGRTISAHSLNVVHLSGGASARTSSTSSTPSTRRKLHMPLLLSRKATMSTYCETVSVVFLKATMECFEESVIVQQMVNIPTAASLESFEPMTPTSIRKKWAVKKREKASTPSKKDTKRQMESLNLRNRGDSDKVLSETGKNDIRHARVMELVVSEQRCAERVLALSSLNKVLLDSKIITEEDAEVLFMNSAKLGQLMQDTHSHLEKTTAVYDADKTLISPTIIRRLIVSLPEYEKYLIGYDSSLRLFESIKENKKANSVLEKNGVSMHDLHSWLAEAMQRLYKYKLTLDSIVKETPEHHIDRDGLIRVSTLVKDFLEDINEQKRVLDSQKMFSKVISLFYPMDQEKIKEDTENGDTINSYVLGGPVSVLEVEDLHYSNNKCDSKTNDVSTTAKQTGQRSLDLLSVSLDPKKIPVRRNDASANQAKEELKKLRGSFSVDFIDEAQGESYAILSDGYLIIAFLDEKQLCLDCIESLDMIWIVEDQERPEELIIVCPGGIRRIGAFGQKTAPSVGWGTINKVEEWKSALSKAITTRVEAKPASRQIREACAVWLEDDGSIVVEERCVTVASKVEVDYSTQSAYEMANVAKNAKTSTTPKRKPNFLGRFGKNPKKTD